MSLKVCKIKEFEQEDNPERQNSQGGTDGPGSIGSEGQNGGDYIFFSKEMEFGCSLMVCFQLKADTMKLTQKLAVKPEQERISIWETIIKFWQLSLPSC